MTEKKPTKKRPPPPPKGNDRAKKLKEPSLQKEAFEDYCAHLAKGKSKRSWRFRKPNVFITYRTMESYMENNPELDPIHIEMAKIDGYYEWESVVEDSAKGVNKDANTASLQMLMRNKFDWDKERKEADNEVRTMLIEFIDHLKKS